MATLTVGEIVRSTGYSSAGVGADVAGDEFVNDGACVLQFYKGIGTSVITIAANMTVHGLDVQDYTATVTAANARLIGPFPMGVFNDANGKVQITYDTVSSLFVEALKIP